MNEILNIIHKTIYQFFDVCEDDEEVPMSDKDKLLLEVNKAICNNLLKVFNVPDTNARDLISRQAAKSKAVYSHERHEKVVPVAELDWLPSVEPERKPGKWIWDKRTGEYECSECGCNPIYEGIAFDYSEIDKYRYCRWCGARMEEDNG